MKLSGTVYPDICILVQVVFSSSSLTSNLSRLNDQLNAGIGFIDRITGPGCTSG